MKKVKREVRNADIREILKRHGIRHYDLALECGVNKTTMSSWLAMPLNEQRRERILDAIDRIIKANS